MPGHLRSLERGLTHALLSQEETREATPQSQSPPGPGRPSAPAPPWSPWSAFQPAHRSFRRGSWRFQLRSLPASFFRCQSLSWGLPDGTGLSDTGAARSHVRKAAVLNKQVQVFFPERMSLHFHWLSKWGSQPPEASEATPEGLGAH